MVARYPDAMALALTADDIERAIKQGSIASLIGMEGGHSINSSLAALRHDVPAGRALHDAHAQPQHAVGRFGDGHAKARRPLAVRRAGRAEMNRLGMLVDLSHVSPATMGDAIRVATAPVIFSHSSARALTDVPRNVPDEILRELPRTAASSW